MILLIGNSIVSTLLMVANCSKITFPSRPLHPEIVINLAESAASISNLNVSRDRFPFPLRDWGQLGVQISQLTVLIEYAERCDHAEPSCGPLVILEDDLIIDANIAIEMTCAFQTLPENWNVLQLGFLFESVIVSSVHNWVLDESWFSVHAWIVRTPSVARRIFQQIHCPSGCVIDRMLNWTRNYPLYRLFPYSLADQDRLNFGTNIPQSGGIRKADIQNPILPRYL